jgi:hypothetical protein
MSRTQQVFFAFAFAAALYAQDSAAPPPQSPTGLETPWSIAPVIQELGAHAGRLLTALDRIDTNAWVAKGASETYGEQLQSCKVQAKAFADGAQALGRNPEQLAASIELFFRIQSLESMLGSLEEGMRKYQKPAEAQALASLVAQAGANRDRFQKYIVDLATDRERQLQITDKEAQRCRALLTAPATSKTGKKK